MEGDCRRFLFFIFLRIDSGPIVLDGADTTQQGDAHLGVFGGVFGHGERGGISRLRFGDWL